MLPARAPKPPMPDRTLQRAQEEHAKYVAARVQLQRRSVLRGLILLALLVLGASILRAGAGRAFPPYWWRP
jgi:hypothetical protein